MPKPKYQKQLNTQNYCQNEQVPKMLVVLTEKAGINRPAKLKTWKYFYLERNSLCGETKVK